MINKSDMLQDIERVLVSEEEIHARIKEVGAQIAEDYRGKCPILVGVLKGVVPFFAEMANAISIPVQEDFMCITSFEGGTESTGKLTFRKDIDHDIEGRHVLILEDIIDSGSTLKMICEMFRERKPASIRICTLPQGRSEAGLHLLHRSARVCRRLRSGLRGLLPEPSVRRRSEALRLSGSVS